MRKGWVWFDNEGQSHSHKPIGKRFGIRQSNKVRVIDDCSCCGLNWTVGLREKFQLKSVDNLASIVTEAFKAFPGLKFPNILGRCYDLKVPTSNLLSTLQTVSTFAWQSDRSETIP